MEEIKSMKELVEERFKDYVKGLSTVQKGDNKYSTMVDDIGKLADIWIKLDKNETAKKEADRKFDEEVRMKNIEIERSDRKFREDIRAKCQELEWKDALERDKMQMERDLKTQELEWKEQIEIKHKDILEREKLEMEKELKLLEIESKEKIERERIESEENLKDLELKSKEITEQNKLEAEKKLARKDTGIKITGVILPIVASVGLTVVGYVFEFVEHGTPTSFFFKEICKLARPKFPTL